MSRKEFDEKCYKEIMDCLHASDDVLEEVLKMAEQKNMNTENGEMRDDKQRIRNQNEYGKNNDGKNNDSKNSHSKNSHGRHWHPARVAAAAVVLCAVAGTMFSTEISTYAEEAIHFIEAKLSPASENDVETFADAALGDKSISTDHAERTNSSGEVLDDPDSQRVAVDSVTANELLVGNVQNVDASVDVGGYTFNFEQLLVDKNGNGMLSYTISNPNGVQDWYESGYGEITFNGYLNPDGGLAGPLLHSESGAFLEERTLLRSDISTDTELHLVTCFAGNLQENESILVELEVGKDDENGESGQLIVQDQKLVTFDVTDKLECVTLTDENGAAAEVSPIGLVYADTTADKNIEDVPESITLKYTDGTEYVIDGEDAYNTVVSLKDSGKSWYVFNRLVDTGKIQSLDIKGHYFNFTDESQENYDRTYTIAE